MCKLHKKISELEKEVKRKEERRTEPPVARERKNEEAEKKTQWKSPISDPIKFTLKLFNSALKKIHVRDISYKAKIQRSLHKICQDSDKAVDIFANLQVVANNHFIWNGKEWMVGLRKGKLIAGGYWVFWRIKITQFFFEVDII